MLDHVGGSWLLTDMGCRRITTSYLCPKVVEGETYVFLTLLVNANTSYCCIVLPT